MSSSNAESSLASDLKHVEKGNAGCWLQYPKAQWLTGIFPIQVATFATTKKPSLCVDVMGSITIGIAKVGIWGPYNYRY